MKMKIVELEDFAFKDLRVELSEADIIWMAGGMSGYLMYWIRRVGLETILTELLADDVIYVGSSAGSRVCGSGLNVAEWFLGEPESGASFIPALGYLDFEICLHYTEDN